MRPREELEKEGAERRRFDEMEGEHAGQHTSELVRLAVLYHHGGVFLDVSILMLRDPDALCWASLADERSPHRVSAWYHINMGQVVHSSLAARRHDPFVYRCELSPFKPPSLPVHRVTESGTLCRDAGIPAHVERTPPCRWPP